MRNLLRFSLLLFSVAALLAGCSDSNLEAPEDAHPANWYQLHRAATTTATYAVDCGGCHVVNRQPGPAVPPSCFSSSFDGRSCHANGPGAPHPVDGTFLDGAVHGPVAKADLTVCQECHSNNPNGGPGSNPRFNAGIVSGPLNGGGCEQCHGDFLAHPADWAGPNTTFHYSAGSVQKACTLCHGVNLDGVNGAGGVAVNCQNCHAETTNFTLDCAACHQFPPDGTTAEPVVAAEGGLPVNHTAVPLAAHDQCAICHGVKNDAGRLNPSATYLAFDKATDTIGSHWDGNINMNGDTDYNATNFGCDFACHANDVTHQLSDSALPVVLGTYGSVVPGGSQHPLGNKWLLKSQHATLAVNNTLACLVCHTQTGGGIDPPCQGCHQVAPKMDLTTNGCPSCHGFPPDGVTPVATDPNVAGRHGVHVAFTPDTANCSSCHQGGGTDSLTHYDRLDQTTPNYPAEVSFLSTYDAKSGAALYTVATQTCDSVSCHGGQTTPNWSTGSLPANDPTVDNVFCLSCHALGTGEYNSYNSGEHDFHLNNALPGFLSGLLCTYCHSTTVLQNGVDGSGPTHWSGLDTQAFELDPANTVGGPGTLVADYNGSTCNPACHAPQTW